MEKFRLAMYLKGNSVIPMNGGTFIITEREYIIKYMIFTVAKFEKDKTLASKISFISRGVNLDDGKKEINLYFFSKTADKVYKLLNLR